MEKYSSIISKVTNLVDLASRLDLECACHYDRTGFRFVVYFGSRIKSLTSDHIPYSVVDSVMQFLDVAMSEFSLSFDNDYWLGTIYLSYDAN